ncbi:MAG TPA: phosphoadenylyl-sulfate reductase [Bacteroidales bacterium]|nr:phosphoadenylyl-sulfate reductase [Bacteroidales bacterium]
MDINELLKKISLLNIEDTLKAIADEFTGQVVFTTSFGIEDQVITDIICKNDIPISIVSIDTGRLFSETYKVHHATLEKYKCKIKVYYPNNGSLQKLLTEKGPYSFYESVENRKECCNIRKVEPLGRALKEMNCWITGIRAEQSPERTNMQIIEEDKGYNIIKLNPIFDWTLDQVVSYLDKNNVPYNSLHHKGYISIGCEPCTRAIKPGEDFRAGRWWWENNSGKECGLHTHGK